MFRTSYVHQQEDLIENGVLYGMFFIHLCKQSSRLEDVLDTSSNLLDCLHKCMKNIPYKTPFSVRSSCWWT